MLCVYPNQLGCLRVIVISDSFVVLVLGDDVRCRIPGGWSGEQTN